VATTYVWETLSAPAPTESGDALYYNFVRSEVVGLIKQPPRIVLDVGCGGGATGAEIKRLYPGALVHGVELSEAAAAIAKTRLDRVLNENVEKLDFAACGFERKSIDLVLFPDVLEHLYDPWNLLRRLRPFLADDAHILASIPNVRNLWLINQLLAGNWDYAPAGLLDVTHIRFFTRKSIVELFEQTGYRIESMGANLDGRVPAAEIPHGAAVDISTDLMVLRKIDSANFQDLRVIQFLVDARPV
jgi:2-polyprenyl-3-methyl-5-hydroxy-6-metoxy-1,4-benzoquinol methylase